jgi:hypothetical protein
METARDLLSYGDGQLPGQGAEQPAVRDYVLAAPEAIAAAGPASTPHVLKAIKSVGGCSKNEWAGFHRCRSVRVPGRTI